MSGIGIGTAVGFGGWGGGPSGVANVVLHGQSLIAELQEDDIRTELLKYHANANVVNVGISGAAMCQAADGGSSKYFVTTALGDGPSLTAAFLASDNAIDANLVTHVIIGQGNQDAGLIPGTISGSDYSDAFDYFISRIQTKYPNATLEVGGLFLFCLTRRGSDVSEIGWQTVREIQAAKVPYLTDCYHEPIRDLQHMANPGLTDARIIVAKRIAAVDGKISFEHPELSNGTHTVNQIIMPISGSDITGDEQIRVFDGAYGSGTEYGVSSIDISGGYVTITTDFADGNLPESALGIYPAGGQVLGLTNGGTDQTPDSVIKAGNGLPLRSGVYESTAAADFGTIKTLISSAVFQLSAGDAASYPATGTVFRDIIGGSEWEVTGLTFATDKFNFTASGQYFGEDIAPVGNWATKSHRTDGAYPVTWVFKGRTPSAFSPGSYLIDCASGLGFDLRFSTAGVPQFAQFGNSSLFRLVNLGAALTVDTDFVIAVKWQLNTSTLAYSINGGAWATVAISPRTATADNNGAWRIGGNSENTNFLQTGANISDVLAFSALLTDQNISDVYDALTA